MSDTTPLFRPNWYDFQKVSRDDLQLEQDFQLNNTAALADAVAGSGVLLERPQEKVVFDSDDLNEFQQGLVAINVFDGRGIFETPYICSDQVGGNQLFIELSDVNLDGFQKLTVLVLGKTFENALIYETLEFGSNIGELTQNHFIEVTNLLFNNLFGNSNTSVDGYGSLNLGGRVLVTEASSMRLGRDAIASEQVKEPDIVLRDFKTWSSGVNLSNTISSAIGTSNDIDDLDINTTTAKTREFASGASTALIYGQKFKMSGNNIQKITLLLGLESGTNWSGTLTVGIRALQDTTSTPTDFLPDSEIGFDPTTEALEEVAITQSDLEDRGIVLTSTTQPVDFYFNDAGIADPDRSELVDEQFYVITIRRSGSTATGTLFIEEARNSDIDLRLTVFDSGVWTDVSDSSLWFKVWRDAVRAASGVAYDLGVRITAPKTTTDNNATVVQADAGDVVFSDTAEDAENYIVAQKADTFTDAEVHPRTGDQVFSKKYDGLALSALTQTEVQTLIDDNDHTVILGRARDRNPKSNPTITGQITLPGLGLHNELHLLNPSSDLLNHNVVGSIITPNLLQPSFKYRIISQETITDLFGDVDGDGDIDVDDAVRLGILDGYSSDLNSGTVSPSIQLAAVLNGSTSVAEILRADVDESGAVGSADLAELNDFINNGTAMSAGSSFARVLLTVEPILNPQFYLDSDGVSSLEIQEIDPSLIDNTSFTVLNYSIEFMPSWQAENIELLDLRRYITTTFLDFNSDDLQSDPESGGLNSIFIPGDLYLTGSALSLDGSFHPLDYEETVIEIDLPEGSTIGTINIFDAYIVDKMRFSNGTLVSSSAINDDQVRFAVSVSSISKQTDGYDFDEPSDGYNIEDVQEVLGTYMDHSTGMLRIYAKNISYNPLLPQIRTRITVVVKLKRAGFANDRITISPTILAELLE